MMKKLVVVVMAVFFSISVASLSFAYPRSKRLVPPDVDTAPANPSADKEMKQEKKAPKKATKKKAAPKKEEAPAAAAPAPTPEKK